MLSASMPCRTVLAFCYRPEFRDVPPGGRDSQGLPPHDQGPPLQVPGPNHRASVEVSKATVKRMVKERRQVGPSNSCPTSGRFPKGSVETLLNIP